MSAHPTLLPSLHALHPPNSLPLLLSRLSLQALHIQPYHARDDVYTATTSVIPGQLRSLRLRAERGSLSAKARAKGKGIVNIDEDADNLAKSRAGDKDVDWEYTMTYLSPPMNGREYAEMSVRACIGLEITGGSDRKEIEGFIETLGFKHSHSYTRSGYLMHLPLPLPSLTPMTIHLSITRLKADTAPTESAGPTSEPYLLTLQPSRPVQAISIRGEPGLEDMMRVMRDVADRMEGVQWETGRG